MCTSALTRLTHTGQKFSEKNFCKGMQPYFEISLLSYIRKIFEQNFCEYLAVYCRWIYKNADEKANTFLRRSKKVKKWTKTGEKRILCKFTFTNFRLKIFRTVAIFCVQRTYLSWPSGTTDT